MAATATRAANDAWLALNIGFPNGDAYFGMVIGRSPYTPEATRVAAKGGTFGGDDAVITWRQAGVGTSLDRGGLVVEVARRISRSAPSRAAWRTARRSAARSPAEPP